MPYTAAVCTDVGVQRNKNEDNFYIANRSMPGEIPLGRCTDSVLRMQRGVVAVFDGMGGSSKGEVAAKLSAETLREYSGDIIVEGVTAVDRYVEDANERVCRFSEESGSKSGTTMVMASLDRDGVTVYNIGDSRGYLLSRGSIYILSEDHTVANQLVNLGVLTPEMAKTDNRRNQLTQHIGIPTDEMKIEAHVSAEHPFRTMDCLLLCSDGVSDVLEGQELFSLMSDPSDCKDIAQAIVDIAMEKGSKDNVTALVVKPLKEEGESPVMYSAKRKLSVPSLPPIESLGIADDIPKTVLPPNPLIPPEILEREDKEKNVSKKFTVQDAAFWSVSLLLSGALGVITGFILHL